jgi:hypothetical protein
VRDFTKSLFDFSSAMAFFGVQELVNIFTPQDPSRQTDKVVAAFSSVTQVTEQQLSDAIGVVFKVGDTLQRGMVDMVFGVLALQSLNPTSVFRIACDIVRESAGPLSLFAERAGAPQAGSLISSLNAALQAPLPALARVSSLFIPESDRRAAMLDFGNKREIFELVPSVSGLLHLPPPGTYVPLTELVARAYSLEPFPALWAVEGLGKYYADTFWQGNAVPQKVLTDESVKDLPPKSLTMLHAGIGMSFASHLLKTVTPHSRVSEIRKVLEEFVTLCKENSREGYTGCALESLGLATRTFYPEMVPIVDRQLLEIDRDVVGYFWHGVGRAIYFNPGLLLPVCGSPWQGIELCWREARHEVALLNAIAGMAWAVTLVNMRSPEVMEHLLSGHGNQLSEGDAFSNGISSSLVMRYDTTPDDPNITPFCQHLPDPSDPRRVELWDREVKGPCQQALREYYPVLKEHNRLEEVFRYQSLPQLVERLKREPGERRLSYPSSERETANL